MLFEPISRRRPLSLLSTITVCETPPPWMMTTSPGRAWLGSTAVQPRARSVSSSRSTLFVWALAGSRPACCSTAETKLAQHTFDGTLGSIGRSPLRLSSDALRPMNWRAMSAAPPASSGPCAAVVPATGAAACGRAPPGSCSVWPGRIRFGSASCGFAATRACSETPCVRARSHSVSPRRTVRSAAVCVGCASGCTAGASGVWSNSAASAARRRTNPGSTWPSAWIQRPNSACAPAVSPALSLRSSVELSSAPAPRLKVKLVSASNWPCDSGTRTRSRTACCAQAVSWRSSCSASAVVMRSPGCTPAVWP